MNALASSRSKRGQWWLAKQMSVWSPHITSASWRYLLQASASRVWRRESGTGCAGCVGAVLGQAQQRLVREEEVHLRRRWPRRRGCLEHDADAVDGQLLAGGGDRLGGCQQAVGPERQRLAKPGVDLPAGPGASSGPNWNSASAGQVMGRV